MATLVACGGEQRELRYAESVSSADRALVQELFPDALAVLRSTEFRENMQTLEGSTGGVYANRRGEVLTLSMVHEIIVGNTWRDRYVSTTIFVIGSDKVGDPSRFHANTGRHGLARHSASVHVGKGVIAQYGSADEVEKSCAINTAAHEITHTISDVPVFYRMKFTDTRLHERGVGRSASERVMPIATYLVGSVAQCTYLQQKRRISTSELRECVKVFGDRAFNDLRCTSFKDGGPVRLDAYLPSAAPPL